jgi:hypothetical protein
MSLYARRVDNDKWGYFRSFDCEFINPQHYSIAEEDIEEYCTNNPFPKSDIYSKDDMIYDITVSGGHLITYCSEEQADWIADMIYGLS